MSMDNGDKRVRIVHDLVPSNWDSGPLSLAHEIRQMLKSIVDVGTNIDSGGGDGIADLWPKVGKRAGELIGQPASLTAWIHSESITGDRRNPMLMEEKQMTPEHEMQMRIEALHMATNYAREYTMPDDIIARAHRYYDFLSGRTSALGLKCESTGRVTIKKRRRK